MCPYDMAIQSHKWMEESNQKAFGSWSEAQRIEFIQEYRKLEKLSCIIADAKYSPFDMILDAVESYFPAYEWNQIHDEDNEINGAYLKLIEMSRDENVTDKEFHDRVMRRNF